MSLRFEESAGAHGAIPLEDAPRRHQCTQYWKDLVRNPDLTEAGSFTLILYVPIA